MQFRLATLFWVMLVFATSMSLAGVWGILLALYWIVPLWLNAGKASKYSVGQAIGEMLAITAILTLLACCLLPMSGPATGA